MINLVFSVDKAGPGFMIRAISRVSALNFKRCNSRIIYFAGTPTKDITVISLDFNAF